MAFWEGELKELGTLYNTFKGHLPDIVKELEQLIKTDDPNVVMLYSRRCLEVIVTDLCENELKRPRKTEPLKGIIDKLNAEEKVPSHIITSMISLNSMANYGAHPKDFDPEQVKPVLNNLAIIIKWYLKYKDFKIVSKSGPEEKEEKLVEQVVIENISKETVSVKRKFLTPFRIVLLIILVIILALIFNPFGRDIQEPVFFDGETGHFTDSRDNHIYTEVRIGDQIWMGENLKAVKLHDGTPIKLVKNSTMWEKTEEPGYCWYDNNKSTYSKTSYGPLYNWFAVNTGKLCPAGWHVPTIEEWQILIKHAADTVQNEFGYLVLENKIAGKKLKESGNSHWAYNDTVNATDEFGFTALPGGLRIIYGNFESLGKEGNFWSSTEENHADTRDEARGVRLDYYSNSTTGLFYFKQSGLSVRCLKDKE